MSLQPTTSASPAAAAPGSPAGSIYDLGYRHYEGPRRGRLFAAWSLYVESLRSVWGLGRPTTAKIAPFLLAGLYALPAVIQLAFSSVITQAAQRSGEPLRLLEYWSYFVSFSFVIVLFLVAQAPELVCRDQRYQVLPLYFTRAMGRADYALARLAALVTALFIALVLPVVALFIGDVLMKPDTFTAISDELPMALPAIPADALIALSLGSISLALSSFTPRRAYAAIGILAYTLLMEAIPIAIYAIGQNANWDWADKVVLATPTSSLGAASAWFFGHALNTETYPTTIGSEAYVVAVVVSCLVFVAVLLVRYRRVAA